MTGIGGRFWVSAASTAIESGFGILLAEFAKKRTDGQGARRPGRSGKYRLRS